MKNISIPQGLEGVAIKYLIFLRRKKCHGHMS